MFRFSPPATTEQPRPRGDRFWSRIRRGYVGSSVLKAGDGSYQTVSYPTQDQIAASAAVYLGGHIYEVSDEEAAALVAAGYTVEAV
jgi:hypothetical protein